MAITFVRRHGDVEAVKSQPVTRKYTHALILFIFISLMKKMTVVFPKDSIYVLLYCIALNRALGKINF